MDDGRSLRERWQDRIERYTPDGTVGRLLFGLLVGAPAVYVGVYGFAVLFGATSLTGELLGLIAGPIFLSAGVAGLLAALVVLWPVYLSVIGSLDEPAAYDTTDPSDETDDPVATLKRRYAAGDVSREEFERRLDALLDDASNAPDEQHREHAPDERTTAARDRAD